MNLNDDQLVFSNKDYQDVAMVYHTYSFMHTHFSSTLQLSLLSQVSVDFYFFLLHFSLPYTIKVAFYPTQEIVVSIASALPLLNLPRSRGFSLVIGWHFFTSSTLHTVRSPLNLRSATVFHHPLLP